jgi:hypothetical protein
VATYRLERPTLDERQIQEAMVVRASPTVRGPKGSMGPKFPRGGAAVGGGPAGTGRPAAQKRSPAPLLAQERSSSLAGVMANGRAIVLPPRHLRGGTLKIQEVASNAPKSPLRSTTITVPGALEIEEIAAAPAGDRLVLRVSRHAVREGAVTELWMCRSDGGGMKMLGRQASPPAAAGRPDQVPRELRWVPGGRRVSFIYQGSLYTLPVD